MNRNVKILLVEDDSNLGSITSDYLIAKGFSCKWVQNGELGYKSFVKNQYELLKKYELTFHEHQILIRECKKKKIKFIYSHFDLESVDMLKKLKLKNQIIKQKKQINTFLI